MKVKAVDIARELGISKATVSLALNGKPGVNPETKKMIFDYKERLEKSKGNQIITEQKELQIIKVLFISKNLKIVYESELDLWTDVLTVFDRISKKLGYTIGISYVNLLEESPEQVINECNTGNVAGVILFATEMQQVDYEVFRAINKPMIIYDNDFKDSAHHRICIDNASAVGLAVEYLLKENCTRIHYLANENDIYNFNQRREGFKQTLEKYQLDFEDKMIIPMGCTIDSVYEKMKIYLQTNELPDAYIMENYQVSIGVMRAMMEGGISVPEDISLIGVDEIPSYVTGYCKLTTIKIAHTDRATMVMSLLQKEIQESIPTKFKIVSDCQLIEGNSVR